jgi:hypothetical protein
LQVLFRDAPDFEFDEDAEPEDVFPGWPSVSVLAQFIIGILNSLLMDGVLIIVSVLQSLKFPEAEITSSLLFQRRKLPRTFS